MAKEQKYLRLGEKASTFNDSSANLSISNRQVVPMTAIHRMSKRVIKALKTGHLEYTSEKKYNKYLTELAAEKEAKPTVDSGNDDSDASTYQAMDEKVLGKMKNEELTEIITENSDITEDDLDGFVKADLVKVIKDGFVLPEDEDDEDDED